jgi:hypothetical protein
MRVRDEMRDERMVDMERIVKIEEEKLVGWSASTNSIPTPTTF